MSNQNRGVPVRPPQDSAGGHFSEYMQADLAAQGYAGDDLAARIEAERERIHPAIQRMIAEADDLAASGSGKFSIDDLFGTQE